MRWVAVAGASNLLGTMPDLPAIARAVHAAGARLFVDAVALAVHRAIDVAAIGCDALVTSAYKWYGPHAAAMYVEPELLRTMHPYKLDGIGRLRPVPARDRHAELRSAGRRDRGGALPPR